MEGRVDRDPAWLMLGRGRPAGYPEKLKLPPKLLLEKHKGAESDAKSSEVRPSST